MLRIFANIIHRHYIIANSVDPDQTAPEQSDLDLHYFTLQNISADGIADELCYG